MDKSKKIIAFFLMVCMITSVFATAAFAGEPNQLTAESAVIAETSDLQPFSLPEESVEEPSTTDGNVDETEVAEEAADEFFSVSESDIEIPETVVIEEVPSETTQEPEAGEAETEEAVVKLLEEPSSGTCGTELTWYVADGVLVLSGEGAMDDYSSENPAPWNVYSSELVSVSIPSGITSIGSYAFDGFTSLCDVSYDGTESEWNSIIIGEGNKALDDANKHFKEDVIPEDGWLEDEYGNKYYYKDGAAVKGWNSIEGNWYYFNDEGIVQTGWQKPASAWYYLGTDGKMVTGWQVIDGEKYFFSDSGAMYSDSWLNSDGSWYYMRKAGPIAIGWQKISDKWYYFDHEGIMQTGWQKINDKWYFFSDSGAMKQASWLKQDNKWYYLNSSGAMTVGWHKLNEKWYYFNASGAMLTGWQLIDGKWYFFSDSGAMKQASWLKQDNKWYYLNSSGAMTVGWHKLNEKWYYFNASGAMLTGWQYLDGHWFYMNSSGAMEKYWLKLGNTWYWMQNTGEMATGWQLIDGLWYYFRDSGAMVTGWLQSGDNWYYFNSNGALKADQASMTTKAQQYSSNTGYLILVDCSSNIFSVFTGSKNNWKLKYYWECATGAGSTKTPKGENTIGYKLYSFSGPDNINPLTYDDPLCYTVYYATNYASGGYFIHSTLYRYGSWDVMDDRLGMDLSHGCIRLYWENAKWVYYNIPYGTKIVTY